MGGIMETQHSSEKGAKKYLKKIISPKIIKKIQPYRREYHIIRESYKININHGEQLSAIKRLKRATHLTGQIIDRKWVLFYPKVPIYASVIHKICLFNGWGMTNDPSKSHILAVKWLDETYCEPDDTLNELVKKEYVINAGSLDISKTYISDKFEQVFGYALSINPLKFHGPCLCKSEVNALHDGEIVYCPVESLKKGYVYQKLVNNEYDEEWVLDYRVPVFNGMVPFLFYNFRHMSNRFQRGRLETEIVETDEVFSGDELEKIKRFCQVIKMDYGELDILRDRYDGRIYIVDANNTPSGPPKALPDPEKKRALIRKSEVFKAHFLKKNITV